MTELEARCEAMAEMLAELTNSAIRKGTIIQLQRTEIERLGEEIARLNDQLTSKQDE